MATTRYTFLDPASLSRTVISWLYVDVIASVLSGAAALIALRDLAVADPSAPKDTPLPSDLLVGVLALGQLAVMLIVAFLVLKWIYRVNRNAHSAVSGLEVRPPWAVGWFFVPIACAWKPFQAMAQTWQASSRPQSWRTVRIPPILRWWWGLYLVAGLLGQVSMRAGLMAHTVADLTLSNWFDVATALLSVPLDLVFIRIVRDLAQMQVVEMTFGEAVPAPA